ncbi:uncharacterized protein [Halyomorpha halys]|uniref:uncharacterized protein n=1 Tax=Halyomorpha halys TaxID=286706 RepID=UPI0006D50A8F|nr:uncharacterized protein LOC106692458 [Halyomorpha halys]
MKSSNGSCEEETMEGSTVSRVHFYNCKTDISGSRFSKESATALDGEEPSNEKQPKIYPFALVLRFRVLQIVCGISSLVMGTVAFIEEHGQVNLGLGMPAGIFTVIAAGVSIHTSRGWSGYREPSCRPSLRFLGPTPTLGAASGILWGTAVCFHAAVLGLAVPAMVDGQQLAAVAVLLSVLSAVTLVAVAAVLHLDCSYDPD